LAENDRSFVQIPFAVSFTGVQQRAAVLMERNTTLLSWRVGDSDGGFKITAGNENFTAGNKSNFFSIWGNRKLADFC